MEPTGIDKWKDKLDELEKGGTEVIRPILSGLPEEKRKEYCNVMIENILCDTNNNITFGDKIGKKKK